MDINWLVVSPPLALLVTASLVVVAGLGLNTRLAGFLSLVGVLVALVLNAQLLGPGEPLSAFGLRYLADTSALAFNTLILLGTALVLLMSFDAVERGLGGFEFYPLLLLSATGGMVMAAAGDFITLLLGLEILSLAVYVLSAWRQGVRASEEAGMKYFLLGAFASAFLIYGTALMYGATGQFTYVGVVQQLQAEAFSQGVLATLAGAFILGGLAFKAAFVPFHQWSPDVYTGAPMPVTAFMSVVVKAAAFAALLRVFATIYPNLNGALTQALVVLVALTLIVGNLAALVQRSVKRLLAYSAVAHAGYLGLALLGVESGGVQAILWYLAAYTFMNVGAFAVLDLLTGRNEREGGAEDRGGEDTGDDARDDLERLAGLGKTRPYLAFAMSLFLLSLAGIPPLAGFIGKLLVFQAALAAGHTVLAVIAILTSIVAAYYYVRIIGVMYFREAASAQVGSRGAVTGIAIALAALATVALGLMPGWWYSLLEAGQSLTGR